MFHYTYTFLSTLQKKTEKSMRVPYPPEIVMTLKMNFEIKPS